MKKLLVLFFVTLGMIMLLPAAKAVTITVSGPTAPELKDRYAGSIIAEDNHFSPSYWYVDPDTQTRLLLKDGISVSTILKKMGIGISNYDLSKIPTSTDSIDIDYKLTHDMRGKFLIQVEEAGQAWYVNPLDNMRYQIANGQEGFKTLKNLAIQINDVTMRAIPESELLGFSQTKTPEIDFSMYNILQNTLKNYYYAPDSINDVDLFYGSLEGMVDALGDPYTKFYTPNDRRVFEDELQGEVEGIGTIVETIDDYLYIVSPLEGSPAEAAGLLPQDTVLKVDGTDIEGWATEDATALIKGPKGTKVTLEIYRPNTAKIFEVTITRDRIELDNVTGKTIDNNIAYFKINLFSNDALNEFVKLKNRLINDSTKGIIVDLRNNPGGYTHSAMNIADYWLEPGDTVLQEQYQDKRVSYKAATEPSWQLPTVILTNQGTASAAEIFTMALDDYDLATVVGQTTFGKGTGQVLEQFQNGAGIKYTVMEWSGPLGNTVSQVGIEPDYIVDNNQKTDLQLQKARDLLK